MDLQESTTEIEHAAAEIGEFQEKQRKDLEGLEKEESELNLDEARKVIGRFHELKAKSEKTSVT